LAAAENAEHVSKLQQELEQLAAMKAKSEARLAALMEEFAAMQEQQQQQQQQQQPQGKPPPHT
jgi:hypothetical protein